MLYFNAQELDIVEFDVLLYDLGYTHGRNGIDISTVGINRAELQSEAYTIGYQDGVGDTALLTKEKNGT